jgi:hypothetical protein
MKRVRVMVNLAGGASGEVLHQVPMMFRCRGALDRAA